MIAHFKFGGPMTDQKRQARIVALVPAFNEQDSIGKTIESLLNQTYPITQIVVIPNNCTDKTAEVARSYAEVHSCIEVLELHELKGKKAGALNSALRKLNPRQWDFVLQMDADTHLDLHLVEEAVSEFERDSTLGGVCSRCLVQPLDSRVSYSWWSRLLWRCQNIEYSLGDSRNVERMGNVKVLAGAVTMYKMEALQSVANTWPIECWRENDLVEDYVLTLDTRENGYTARAGLGMYAWTQVPLTLRDLQTQRDRWYAGTINHLRERGYSPVTRQDILGLAWRVIGICLNLTYLFAMTYVLTAVSITDLSPHPIALFVVLVSFADYALRLRYLRNPDATQYFMVLLLLPWQIYALWDDYLVVRSFVLSYRKHESW